MKLREKFESFAYCSDGNNSMERQYQREDNAIECEKIADEFAIEFAEWLNGLDINDEVLQKHVSSYELLKIFKKEKGL